jgi:hypothetical protein
MDLNVGIIDTAKMSLKQFADIASPRPTFVNDRANSTQKKSHNHSSNCD